MEEAVEKQYSPGILAAAAAAFGADPEHLESLGDFESYVYGYERDGEPLILRVTHDSHRSAGQILSELDWVEHVAAGGVRIARPVDALNGDQVVTLNSGPEPFHACSFTRMPGRKVEKSDWNPTLYRRWGGYVGRIHRLTQSYRPAAHVPRRLRWDEDPYWLKGREWISPQHEITLQRWDEVSAQFLDFSEDPNSFGICHTDLHPGNFHLENGHILAFDTDDATYHWFAEDLSSLLYYGVGHRKDLSAEEFARSVWPEIWRGYREEHDLAEEWIDRLEVFMQWRRLVLYSLVQMKLPPESDDVAFWETIRRDRIDPAVPIFPVDLRDMIEWQ